MLVIKQLWKWHTCGWLPSGLLDLWIEHVFPIYLQDTSTGSDCFWHHAVSEGRKIIEKAEPTPHGRDETKWYVTEQCCNGHAHRQTKHAHLILKDVGDKVLLAKRTQAQWLKLFPVSSPIDYDKQRLHVLTILHAYRVY